MPPDPNTDPVIRQTEQMLILCGHFFNVFCEQNDVSLDDRAKVPIQDFVMWLQQMLTTMGLEGELAHCEMAGVDHDETWNFFYDKIHQQDGINQLAGVWYQICLKHRGEPAHELDSIHLAVILKYKDGQVCPLSSFVPSELSSMGGKFTDGTACTLVQSNAHGLMEMIRDMGLDGLYHQSTSAPDQAYEELMGLIVMILNGAAIIPPGKEIKHENHVKLNEASRDPCLNVQRLLQGLFRPIIPPQVKEMIANRRARLEQQEGDPGKPSGGWD